MPRFWPGQQVAMFLVFVVVLLSSVINGGSTSYGHDGFVVVVPGVVPFAEQNSSIVHETVADLNETSSLILALYIATHPLCYDFTGGLLQSSASINNDDRKASRAMPKHFKPKLCNGHLGKQECSFKLHVGSRSQSKNILTRESALFDLLNLSMVLCSLPISYILFISLQKY